MQPAKSLVILPLSTVSTQAFSRALHHFCRSALPSSLPLCSSPRVQAKILAMGLVLVGLPCKRLWQFSWLCMLSKATLQAKLSYEVWKFESNSRQKAFVPVRIIITSWATMFHNKTASITQLWSFHCENCVRSLQNITHLQTTTELIAWPIRNNSNNDLLLLKMEIF